jgi:DinB superfamily
MKATESEVESYLAILAKSPKRIAQAVRGFDETRLCLRADVKPWRVKDILAHLRSCSDLWTHSIYAMLAENEPVFSGINERTWAKVTRCAKLPFHESFQMFSLQRKSLVIVLRDVPFEAWERSGIIFERRHSVFTQTRRMAKHENEHCEQIESMLRESL